MKNISLKVEDDLHALVSEKADEIGLSLAEFVRVAIRAYCTVGARVDDAPTHGLVNEIRAQLRVKDTQIEGLTQQIDHLTQLLALKEKNVAALTEQLDDSRRLICDMRTPWWKRLFRQGEG